MSKHRLGKSLSIDLYGCKGSGLDNKEFVEDLLQHAAKEAKATVLNIYVHQFSPQGITGVIAISESHMAVHTWPEYDFVSVDIYTCGDIAMPDKAKDYVIKKLQPQRHEIKEQTRGNAIFLDK